MEYECSEFQICLPPKNMTFSPTEPQFNIVIKGAKRPESLFLPKYIFIINLCPIGMNNKFTI